ncbi:MAG: peptidylprolyl isomerase [Proteobacteria bacterium]|nr:peptidylprolyl isomerase [Pseudomonadota bacterium]
MKTLILIGMLLTQTLASAAEKPAEKKAVKNPVAVIKTTLGTIELTLFKTKAPKTVENFIGLAKGTKTWTDPASGKTMKGKSLYKGTIFHRVIPGFMIQGGDPLGQGVGGPGYQFEDEFSPLDNFNKPGILAMANAGPATNGSQFFITVAPTPHLNQHHTIFGEVTKGQDVVEKIANVQRDPMDKPLKDVKIESISIK